MQLCIRTNLNKELDIPDAIVMRHRISVMLSSTHPGANRHSQSLAGVFVQDGQHLVAPTTATDPSRQTAGANCNTSCH